MEQEKVNMIKRNHTKKAFIYCCKAHSFSLLNQKSILLEINIFSWDLLLARPVHFLWRNVKQCLTVFILKVLMKLVRYADKCVCMRPGDCQDLSPFLDHFVWKHSPPSLISTSQLPRDSNLSFYVNSTVLSPT